MCRVVISFFLSFFLYNILQHSLHFLTHLQQRKYAHIHTYIHTYANYIYFSYTNALITAGEKMPTKSTLEKASTLSAKRKAEDVSDEVENKIPRNVPRLASDVTDCEAQ